MDLREYIKIYDDAIPPYAIASFVKIANTLDFEEGKTGKILAKDIREFCETVDDYFNSMEAIKGGNKIGLA